MREVLRRGRSGFCLLLLLMVPAGAAHAAFCRTVAACADALPSGGCALENPASWSCGRVPRLGDTWVINSGHTARVSGGDPFIGSAGTINGTLEFSADPDDRSPSGFSDLNVRCEAGTTLYISPGGTLRLRKGDRLRFDSSNLATCVLSVQDGGRLDIQGSVWQTAIAAGGVEASIDPLLCGPTSSGRTYRLTLDSLPAGATDASLEGRRIVFQSGRAVTRQYEIVAASVAASSVSVCVDLDDAWSFGQRLTPHATLGARDRPPVRHPMPSAGPSEACLETPGQPAAYGCCTGLGTGDCLEALPEPGDAVAVVEDAWVEERSGFRGVTLMGPFTGNDPLPTLRAMNFGQRPGAFKSPYSAVAFTGKRAGQAMPPFEYNNIHDQSGFAPVLYHGVQNAVFRWNAVHDDGPRATPTQAGIYVVQSEPDRGACGCGADDIVIADNVLYRTVGNAITAGAFGGATRNHRMTVTRNLVYQGCTVGSGECNGIEMDVCDDCSVIGNVVYDVGVNVNGGSIGMGINIDDVNQRNVVLDNWLVNLGSDGIRSSADTTATHNYVSHTWRESASYGRYYGNLFRDAWLGAADGWGMVHGPGAAEGNVLLGLEDDLVDRLPCAGGAACARYGFYLPGSIPGTDPIVLEDNLVIGLASIYTGAAVYLPQGDPPARDVTVRHLTFDNRGRHQPSCKRAVRDAVDVYATPSP
ncbi:MAG TPA: right-handed parallel beta-helix repeat-containing protein, partial [Dongiaceae bacterium]|nr:right-handed parallel beta-helix repeat-containing protein [Dongiaceae bacterium]